MKHKECDYKKVFFFIIVGLFLTSMMVEVVSAASLFDPIKDMFGAWKEGDLSANIVKYILWFIVAILVYGIAGMLPGLDELKRKGQDWVLMLLSFLVGFLAVAYFTPAEIGVLMASYSALGFALGFGLPAILLFFFTIKLAESNQTETGRKILGYVLWGMFGFWIIYKLFLEEFRADLPNWYMVLLWVTLGLVVLMMLFMAKIFSMVRKAATKEELSTVSQNTIKGFEMLRKLSEGHDTLRS
jgi:hypothetical protein